MTAAQRRALTILADQKEDMAPSTFADKMWPDTHRRSGQGSGLAGGGYLGKLRKQGLVYYAVGRAIPGSKHRLGGGYRITSKGRYALASEAKP
jgi:hypothetical protein